MKLKKIAGHKSLSLNFISLKAKLIIAILTITLGCALITGYLALQNGQTAHNDSIRKQLITLREAQVNALQNRINTMQSQVDAFASDPTTMQAMNEFSAAYKRLEAESLDSEVTQQLQAFYKNKIIKILNSTQENIDPDRYIPRTRSGKLLQHNYLASIEDAEKPRNSKYYYNGVHSHYHKAFQQITDKFGFADMYLVDLSSGAIVYSVNKKPDYATRLLKGPYEASPLGHLFAELRKHQIPGKVRFSDFGLYLPNDNQATAFVGTTLFDENQLAIGVLIFAIKTDAIDQVLQQQSEISASIGESTETLVIGQDHLLRSNVRFIHGHTDDRNRLVGCYARILQKQQKMEQETANQICRTQSARLLQTINNEAVDKALDKESGLGESSNYLGEKVIAAYAPLRFGQLNWAVSTQILKKEANQSIHDFQRNLMVSIILIICAVTFLSMLMAYLFVNPVSKLTAAAKRLSRGDADIAVHSDEPDEYGELGRALQQTAENMQQQQLQLQNTEQENRQLLRNTLPERFVQQYLDGNRDHSEQIKDATVLYLILEQQYAENGRPIAFPTINLAMEYLYQIAGKNGAEYIRVMGNQLIACFGFRRTRSDYTKRCLHCAQQLQQEIGLFNQQNHTDLALRIGIASAALTTGIMYLDKDRHFSYDVTGPALDNALQLAALTPVHDISLSESSYRQLPESRTFTSKQVLTADGIQLTVWQLRHEQPQPDLAN